VRASLVCAALVGTMYTIFVWDFLKRPIPLVYRCSNLVLCLLAAIVSFWDSEYTLTGALPHVKDIRVFGREITLYEPEYAPLSMLLLLGFIVTVAMLAGCDASAGRSSSRVPGRAPAGSAGLTDCGARRPAPARAW
jgi:hypothetical protein